MNTRYDTFEDLRVWQEGMKLCKDVYHSFRYCREFGLRDQIQRSAVSIPSNIAEGFERQSDKEFVRYLFVAKASCGELRTQLLIAISVVAVDQQVGETLVSRARILSAMLQKLIDVRRRYGKR